MYDYIIIGNGIAGFTCAKEIRSAEEDAKIVLISNESNHTYWRTRLSDLICKDFTPDQTLVQKVKWYEENNVEEKLGVCVDRIDRENKLVILDNGEELAYDKALLATGSHSFVPPIENADVKGVFAIRTIEDLIEFKETIAQKNEVIVIGGGLLGLEAAYSIRKLGLDVLVVEAMPHILSKQLDPKLSQKLEAELKDMGIQTITGESTKKILEEDGHAKGIELSNGEVYNAEAIMIQAGVRSNIEVAQNSGLKTDRGICVDETLKTEDDDIYAAGDCAQIGDMTIGLWTASQEMGQIAGANMTGGHETYHLPKPFSSLLLGSLRIFSAGITSGDGVEEIREEDGEKIYKLFKKDGKYVGGILYKDILYQNDVKKIVFENEDPANTKLGKEIFGL